jgi:hypothetical protein
MDSNRSAFRYTHFAGLDALFRIAAAISDYQKFYLTTG